MEGGRRETAHERKGGRRERETTSDSKVKVKPDEGGRRKEGKEENLEGKLRVTRPWSLCIVMTWFEVV